MSNTLNVPTLGQRLHAAAEELKAALPQTSLDVARQFGKPHKQVLAAIERLRPELTNVQQGYFQPIDHGNAYRLTHDGFTLLALSFQGQQARAFKQAYLEAFNSPEGALLHSTRTLPPVDETPSRTTLGRSGAVFQPITHGYWSHARC